MSGVFMIVLSFDTIIAAMICGKSNTTEELKKARIIK